MKPVLPTCLIALSPLLLGAVETVPNHVGLACTGSETVQNAGQAPIKAPYEIMLSLDLGRRLYCYGACGVGQTYPIVDGTSSPIILADLQQPIQSRHIVYDRATGILTDDQHIALGADIVMDRHAKAMCKAAAFHPPSA